MRFVVLVHMPQGNIMTMTGEYYNVCGNGVRRFRKGGHDVLRFSGIYGVCLQGYWPTVVLCSYHGSLVESCLPKCTTVPHFRSMLPYLHARQLHGAVFDFSL